MRAQTPEILGQQDVARARFKLETSNKKAKIMNTM